MPPAPDTAARPKADAPAGGPSPDRQAVRRLVAELVLADEPAARNIRIVYDVPAGDGGVMTGRIPVPAVAPEPAGVGDEDDGPFAPERLTPMQQDVVQAIDEMPVGTVLSYAALADKAGCNNSGPFREFVKDYAKATRRIAPHPRGRGWEKIE